MSGLAGTTRAAEVTAFFLEAAAARMEAAIKVRHNVMYGLCWRSSGIRDLLCLHNQALLCIGVPGLLEAAATGMEAAIKVGHSITCAGRSMHSSEVWQLL